MPDTMRPEVAWKRGDPILATWLRAVADAVIQRITITGGTIRRIGTSVVIDVSGRRGGKGSVGAVRAYKATSAPDGNDQITVKLVNSDGTVTGDESTWEVLPE